VALWHKEMAQILGVGVAQVLEEVGVLVVTLMHSPMVLYQAEEIGFQPSST